MDETPRRAALVQGLSAYVLWGLVVLFWPLLKHVPAWEILAHRIIWSFVVVALVLVVLKRPWTWLRTVASDWMRLLPATVLIAVNWGVFIWAVNANHVAETSLGYFLNPIVNVALGMLFFRERPGGAALIGVLLAAFGVAWIAVEMTGTVWVSLTLALSFGLYGAAKKRTHLGALQGLALESGLLTPVAIGYLLWFGTSAFSSSWRDALLLFAGGVITAVPLWLFAKAAPRIPLGVLGMLQFIAPTMTLILSVTWFGQQVPWVFWAGLALIWCGTALYLAVFLRTARRRTKPAAEAAR
ncbi:MAG TPA: EamA family transporter RarD [Propionibacteriaceae bacterium]|nr:EamA family transporter RarD [Propionibacteriaceae bacterium]